MFCLHLSWVAFLVQSNREDFFECGQVCFKVASFFYFIGESHFTTICYMEVNRAVSLPHLHNFLDVYATPFIKKKKTRTCLKSRGDEAEKLTYCFNLYIAIGIALFNFYRKIFWKNNCTVKNPPFLGRVIIWLLDI